MASYKSKTGKKHAEKLDAHNFNPRADVDRENDYILRSIVYSSKEEMRRIQTDG